LGLFFLIEPSRKIIKIYQEELIRNSIVKVLGGLSEVGSGNDNTSIGSVLLDNSPFEGLTDYFEVRWIQVKLLILN
jgi:hypothetical protein